jgi:hypothetical protein
MRQDTIPSISKSDRAQRELDLLGRWQASPAGRVAAATNGLFNEISELERLSRNPENLRLIDGEGDDLSLCSQRLSRLLLRLSAYRASQDDNEQLRYEYERGQQ